MALHTTHELTVTQYTALGLVPFLFQSFLHSNYNLHLIASSHSLKNMSETAGANCSHSSNKKYDFYIFQKENWHVMDWHRHQLQRMLRFDNATHSRVPRMQLTKCVDGRRSETLGTWSQPPVRGWGAPDGALTLNTLTSSSMPSNLPQHHISTTLFQSVFLMACHGAHCCP